MPTPTLEDELRATRWGALLAPEQLQRCAAECAVLTVAEGGYVCRRGAPVDAWVGVLDGMLKMTVTTPDGRAATFTNLPPGSWFGEGSLLKTEPRRYDVVALTAARAVRMPRRTFEWLLNTSIPFNRFLLVQLNERLGQFIGMLESQRLHDPDARVARCVAGLFNPVLYPHGRAHRGVAGRTRPPGRHLAPARQPGAANAGAGAATARGIWGDRDRGSGRVAQLRRLSARCAFAFKTLLTLKARVASMPSAFNVTSRPENTCSRMNACLSGKSRSRSASRAYSA